MAYIPPGAKPLPEAMIIQVGDAYMHHHPSVAWMPHAFNAPAVGEEWRCEIHSLEASLCVVSFSDIICSSMGIPRVCGVLIPGHPLQKLVAVLQNAQSYFCHVRFMWYLVLSCDQAALWTVCSVRPSVHPSASHFFYYVPAIASSCFFQESLPWPKAISIQKQKVRVKGKSHRVQKQFLHQFGFLRTITPVWIDKWLWNDAHSLK